MPGRPWPAGTGPCTSPGPVRLPPQLGWTESGRRLNFIHTDASPPAHTRVSEKSRQAPALTRLGDELALAWAGTDRHLNIMVSKGRSFGEQPFRLEEKSSEAPALCAEGNGLVLAWTGTNFRLNVGLLREGDGV